MLRLYPSDTGVGGTDFPRNLAMPSFFVSSSLGKGIAVVSSAVQEFLSVSKNKIKNLGNMRSCDHTSIQIDKLENKVETEKMSKNA
jgi:hypothetical protein